MLDRLREEVESDIEAGLDSGMLLTGIEVDILDTGDAIVVRANVPGFEKDDVRVTAEDDQLVIAADVASDGDGTVETGDGDTVEGAGRTAEVLRRERPQRDLRRIVRLPTPVVADDASASCELGVLEVTLPKADETDGTAIAID